MSPLGKNQIIIGGKVVQLDDNGILQATSVTKINEHGGTDVEIHIPCLKIMNKQSIKEEVGDACRGI